MAWRSPAVLLLGVLLLVQIVFSIWFLTQTPSSSGPGASGSLLPAGTGDIDTIAIGDGERRLVLTRDDDRWVLSSYDDLPVDGDRMALLLTGLAALGRDAPVATTDDSHVQLEVSADEFQRRLSIGYRADNGARVPDDVELLIGSSPGYRRAHLRRADESSVYAARINVFDLPVEPGDWLPRDLLALDAIERIEGPGFALERSEIAADDTPSNETGGDDEGIAPSATRWVFADAPDREVDQTAADGLVRAFLDLGIEGLVPAEDSSGPDTIEFTVTTSGETYRYRIAATGDTPWIARDDRDQRFALAPLSAETLAAVDRAGLETVLAPETTPDDEPDTARPGGTDARDGDTGQAGADRVRDTPDIPTERDPAAAAGEDERSSSTDAPSNGDR